MLLARGQRGGGGRARPGIFDRGLACAAVLVCGCGARGAADEPERDDAASNAVDAAAVESRSDGAGREGATQDEDATTAGDTLDSLVVVPGAFMEENAPLRILQDADAIDLWRAPQGGHVVLLAAQVRNMSTAAATIRVRMRRPDTGFIVAEEKRTVAMVPVEGEADTMQPDLRSRSQVAHVPLCPDYDPIDVVAQPLDVEIEVTALYTDPPRVGSARLTLVPACRQATEEDEGLCRCECKANYALGKCAGDARAP